MLTHRRGLRRGVKGLGHSSLLGDPRAVSSTSGGSVDGSPYRGAAKMSRGRDTSTSLSMKTICGRLGLGLAKSIPKIDTTELRPSPVLINNPELSLHVGLAPRAGGWPEAAAPLSHARACTPLPSSPTSAQPSPTYGRGRGGLAWVTSPQINNPLTKP